ncbi:MAG: c-type cytochrome [Phycisphaeraceae bacterium]|nr:c-type cytochrome [Phycisphaeraceae bacterium]
MKHLNRFTVPVSVRNQALSPWLGVLTAAAVAVSASCDSAGPGQSGSTAGTPTATPSASVVPAAPPTTQAAAADARTIFAANCASCHGTEGKGDGPAAYLVYPKPRNFTTGSFRFKSTPTDQPPTADDLRRIIKGGIQRTAMPSFAGTLTDEQIDMVGQYVVSLGPKHEGSDPLTPLKVPDAPTLDQSLAQQGKLIYQSIGCAVCHGETGKGDGPSSNTLADTDGYPLPAADFTMGVYKSGSTPGDLYRAVYLGVPGTPMPAFGESFKSLPKIEGVNPQTDATWALVAFLKSLETPREETGVSPGAVITATAASDAEMLKNPLHAGWEKVKPVAATLQPLWQRRSFARSIEVRAVQVGDQIAFRLDWPDTTVDTVAGVNSFADAGALMFSLSDGIPPLTMGAGFRAGDVEALVNIWQWKASRQLNADESRLHDTVKADVHPPADMYMFKKGDPVKGPITEHDKTYITAWGAGNPNADPALQLRPVIESNAAGFGSLTQQPVGEQNVEGAAKWRDGRWCVLMSRTLKPANKTDVNFVRSTRVPVAFAVWDGHSGDRNGTKLISGWYWLEIKP